MLEMPIIRKLFTEWNEYIRVVFESARSIMVKIKIEPNIKGIKDYETNEKVILKFDRPFNK